MTKRWELDYERIKKAIDTGIEYLNNPNISRYEKNYIKKEIKFLRNFLKKDFQSDVTNTTNKHIAFEKLKDTILHIMRKQYKTLGKELIDFIISLNQEKIFEYQNFQDETLLSIDEQAELTIKNYELHSKFLLKYAKEILSAKSNVQIQLANNLDCSSYCYYSNIAKLSYLIINPNEAPWILNHEVQHSIEDILNYNTHNIFMELGPIYFELLFLDTLYQKQGFLLEGDYQLRLDGNAYRLCILAEYFKVMKIFAAMDFQVSTNKFREVFIENTDIIPEELELYLTDEIISGEVDYDIGYLLSHLKAIELRQLTKSTNEDSFNILIPYIKPNRFNFKTPTESFKLYETYIDELKQKTRIKK